MIILWMLWAALTSTVFICGTVAWFMPAIAHPLNPTKTHTLFVIMAVLSGVLLSTAIFIYRRTCRAQNIQKALKNFLDGRTSLEPNQDEKMAMGFFGDSPAETAVAKALFNGCVTSWVLAELVAIHGFALSHMSGHRQMYLSFALPAFIFMIFSRPPGALVRKEISRLQLHH